MKKGSIFRKLIASYFVFAVSAIVIVVGVSVISVILAVANSNPAFPVLLTDGDGNIQDIEGIQRLGGWVEELDEDYRVRSIYGEKKTETTQYTPEFLLEWTDQKSGNSAFHLYWQKKSQEEDSGYYLIYYPKEAFRSEEHTSELQSQR